jgi:hypothetical protein
MKTPANSLRRRWRSGLLAVALAAVVGGVGIAPAFADGDWHRGDHDRYAHDWRGGDWRAAPSFVYAAPGYAYYPAPGAGYSYAPPVYAAPSLSFVIR